MATREGVKIVHGALDLVPSGDIILRGVISPDSLKFILADDYQREVLPLSAQNSLVEAFKSGRQVPDVTLGMRGGDYLERNEAFFLRDDVYVIDGLQRISSALHVLRTGLNLEPRLGATVTFNTTKETERELFRILNTEKTRLSPNILIRNLREENQAVDMLIAVCEDESFVLHDRVCWQQRMRRGEFISASTLLKVTGQLHSSFGPGVSSQWNEAAKAILRTMRDMVGRRIMAQNIKVFFEVIDGAFGIRSVSYKEGAAYLKSGFLLALARVIAQHKNFWDEHRRLTVSADFRRKLSTFPVGDPNVSAMCGSSNVARQRLMIMIVEHLNSGKRTHRLVPFKTADVIAEGAVEDAEQGAA